MGCALAGLWLVSPLLALLSVESVLCYCRLVKHWSGFFFQLGLALAGLLYTLGVQKHGEAINIPEAGGLARRE